MIVQQLDLWGKKATVFKDSAIGPSCTSPIVVADYLMKKGIHLLEQEELWVFCLDIKNRIFSEMMIARGNGNSACVDASVVFREAVRKAANAIVIIHNHPSGDPTPSPEDIEVANHLAQAGKLLGIEVLDCIILGNGRFVSLKERGKLI